MFHPFKSVLGLRHDIFKETKFITQLKQKQKLINDSINCITNKSSVMTQPIISRVKTITHDAAQQIKTQHHNTERRVQQIKTHNMTTQQSIHFPGSRYDLITSAKMVSV